MAEYTRLVGMALRNPSSWLDLAGLAWAARRRGWWRRAPFLPLPPRRYLRWRNETAWGDPDATGSERELLRYLRWAARMRRRS